jgi:hypothetical protein
MQQPGAATLPSLAAATLLRVVVAVCVEMDAAHHLATSTTTSPIILLAAVVACLPLVPVAHSAPSARCVLKWGTWPTYVGTALMKTMLPTTALLR